MRKLLPLGLASLVCICSLVFIQVVSAEVQEEDILGKRDGAGEGLPPARTEEMPEFRLGEEYSDYSKDTTRKVSSEEARSERGFAMHVLMYLPNRFLDLLDIARVRVRVGPGIGVNVRVTRPLQVGLGSYATLYAGLPGPRRNVSPVRSPIGAELYTGAALSVLSLETKSFGPHYSTTEIGVGAQALLVGADVGIDPLEIVDFILGFVFIDIADDDL